jgi:hypothetical protein
VHRAWPWCWMVYVFMTPWALDVQPWEVHGT